MKQKRILNKMVMKITDNNWINRDSLSLASFSVGGLHLFGKIAMDFTFVTNSNDSVSVSVDLVPHTLILDRVGTDYEKVEPKLATERLIKSDISWGPMMVTDYISKLNDNEGNGMNLPSFKNWVEDMLVTSEEEDEYGVKEHADKTIKEYLDSLEQLVKEKVWQK